MGTITTYLVTVEDTDGGEKFPTIVERLVHARETCTVRTTKITDPEHKCNNGDRVMTVSGNTKEQFGEGDEGTVTVSVVKVARAMKAPAGAEGVDVSDVDALLTALTTVADE